MRKKDLIFILVLVIFVVLFLWQWNSQAILVNQANSLEKLNEQMMLMTGIGTIGSTHIHANIKVYLNGQALDFSQRKYQVATSYIHFEDGMGDVIHVHATGLALEHLFHSIRMDFTNNCIFYEGQNYCNEGDKKLKFYVNGQTNNEFGNRIIKDLDKYLISFGNENESDIQKQIESVTNLAPHYSSQSQYSG